MNKVRINSLDYLRGLMAFGIMIYHFFSWTFHPYKSETFLGVIGTYGVPVFYILSGLTLYFVYQASLSTKTILPFYIKRAFRILPLLWVSIALNIFLLNKSYDTQTILLNITGLFGFLDHDNYITTGAWSIGNELVFYAFFPLLVLLPKWKPYLLEVFFGISVLLGLYFGFYVLDSTASFVPQWPDYINPFNQLFFFVGGIVLGKYAGTQKNNKKALILFSLCALFVAFYPVEGETIRILSGYNRILYSLIAFTLTYAFLLLDIKDIKPVDFVLAKLGHISYSVYLIHAIVFWYLAMQMDRKEAPAVFLTIGIVATLIISLLVYEFYEKKAVTIGKKVANRIAKK